MAEPPAAALNPLVIALGIGLLLSLFGAPWLRQPRPRSGRESIRTKWIYFEWSHPFLAAALARALAGAAIVALARSVWIWSPLLWHSDSLSSLHNALGFALEP